MHNTFDRIHHDRVLMSHWVRRFTAGIVDFVLAGLSFMFLLVQLQVLVAVAGPLGPMFLPSLFGGVVWFLYSAGMEATLGYTVGKRLVNLRVRTTGGSPPDWIMAAVRNLSKVSGPLFVLDVLLGFATEGDPRQRALDRVARTTVVAADLPEHYV